MKLTTELLKQLIKEELAESYRKFRVNRGNKRTSRAAIDNARTLLLYRPNEPGGMKVFPIIRKQDGDFMRFFIEDEVDESGKIGTGVLEKIQIFPTSGGQRILRMGKVVSTDKQIDLIPKSKTGARSHISLK